MTDKELNDRFDKLERQVESTEGYLGMVIIIAFIVIMSILMVGK